MHVSQFTPVNSDEQENISVNVIFNILLYFTTRTIQLLVSSINNFKVVSNLTNQNTKHAKLILNNG